MKAVILAGGYGTRLSEETVVRPKPMVEIGGQPILWHIMKHFAVHGVRDFIICGGYRQDAIRRYFADFRLNVGDVVFDLEHDTVEYHGSSIDPWRVTVVDTGHSTMTAGRRVRARAYIGTETFFLAYGDCVSDVDLTALLRFHRRSNVSVTLTAVQPPGRFGTLTIADGEVVTSFAEKPSGDGAWINGGFFVVEPAALDLVRGDDEMWEHGPIATLTSAGRLAAFRHTGYWQNMDSLRDKMVLEQQWASGAPGWKTW